MISGSGFLLRQQRQSRRRKDGGGPVGQRDPVVAMCGVCQLFRQRHRGGKRQSGPRQPPLRSRPVTQKGFGFLAAQQRLYLGMFFCCSQRQELMLKLNASCGGKKHTRWPRHRFLSVQYLIRVGTCTRSDVILRRFRRPQSKLTPHTKRQFLNTVMYSVLWQRLSDVTGLQKFSHDFGLI